MANFYEQYINQLFNPPPRQIPASQGTPSLQGPPSNQPTQGLGFGFGDFFQQAARGRRLRNQMGMRRPLYPGQPSFRRFGQPQQQPMSLGQGIGSPQTRAAFNGVPNAVPMLNNPNVFVHPETANPRGSMLDYTTNKREAFMPVRRRY